MKFFTSSNSEFDVAGRVLFRASFGQNAARLYNIDLKAKRNPLPDDAISKLKTAYLDNGGRRSNEAFGWVRADD